GFATRSGIPPWCALARETGIAPPGKLLAHPTLHRRRAGGPGYASAPRASADAHEHAAAWAEPSAYGAAVFASAATPKPRPRARLKPRAPKLPMPNRWELRPGVSHRECRS